jgi:hypothetical protein
MHRVLILGTLILFGILTTLAILHDGVTGVFASIIHSYGSLQIYVDLVIAAMLINIWIWHDARSQGRNPWGWIIATMIVGSFSPLVYLLTRRQSVSQQ